MFEVRADYPLEDYCDEKEDAVKERAGRASNFAGAGMGRRDHGWKVNTFQDAQEMRARLETLSNLHVTIREA